jgi:hypothetical protein
LRGRGKTVFPINPTIEEFLGDRCYRDVASLPQRPDGIVIVTRPEIAEGLIRECAAAGIPRVWLHNMLGTRPRFMKAASAKMTSVPASAVEICRRSGMTVIPGSCPMQFIGDLGHRCMRGILKIAGPRLVGDLFLLVEIALFRSLERFAEFANAFAKPTS